MRLITALRSLSVAFAMLLPVLAIAHEGHGTSAAMHSMHHGLWLLTATGLIAVVVNVVMMIRNRNSN